jgi:5-formyltetrahydrofolate cyclo-ligase
MSGGGLPKSELRARWRRRRSAVLPGSAAAILSVARRQVPALLPPDRLLGLWWPLAGEPDLLALRQQLPERLALPAIVPWNGPGAGAHAGRRLLYRRWREEDDLEPDLCGIPAPAATDAGDGNGGGGDGDSRANALKPEQLGLLLVPALAVDAGGLRLGSGGGWYDRLRADPRWRAIPALAVLPAACVTDALPRDPWDVPFDGWIDEAGLHWAAAAAKRSAS